jgi:hypothetical protein
MCATDLQGTTTSRPLCICDFSSRGFAVPAIEADAALATHTYAAHFLWCVRAEGPSDVSYVRGELDYEPTFPKCRANGVLRCFIVV